MAISSLDPSAGMALTNTYSLIHGDIESIAVQGKAGDEGELVLSVKQAVRTAMQDSSCNQTLVMIDFDFISPIREIYSLSGSIARLNARSYFDLPALPSLTNRVAITCVLSSIFQKDATSASAGRGPLARRGLENLPTRTPRQHQPAGCSTFNPTNGWKV